MIDLNRIISEKGLSTEALASAIFTDAKTQVSAYSSLSRVRRGLQELSTSELVRLAEYIGEDVGALFPETVRWRSTSIGGLYTFTKMGHKAVLDTATWTLSVTSDKGAVEYVANVDKAYSLTAFLKFLDETINKSEKL